MIKDITGKDVLIGDVISSPDLEFGTTFEVLDVSEKTILVRRKYRGRKSIWIYPPSFRIVSRF